MSTPCSIHARLALESIECYFSGKALSPLRSHELVRRAACFVTLHTSNGALRGCMGTIEPCGDSLYQEIITNARAAAFRDYRFSPVQQPEIFDLDVGVDVLTELEMVGSKALLDPSLYGVVVQAGNRRGVLLPNLPSVTSVEDQLSIAKRKASISNKESVVIYRFMVERYH